MRLSVVNEKGKPPLLSFYCSQWCLSPLGWCGSRGELKLILINYKILDNLYSPRLPMSVSSSSNLFIRDHFPNDFRSFTANSIKHLNIFFFILTLITLAAMAVSPNRPGDGPSGSKSLVPLVDQVTLCVDQQAVLCLCPVL